ncbi:hypothetical protein MMC08_006268 [Hypocenomyce scalaris]|nr:hypothetical protein [Hypocenomyce scalaris]
MSREELFQEFGRLQHANTSLEQAVAAAERRERTLRNEHTELTARKGELTAANAELSQGLEASKAEVERLMAQIGKMEKTIKVQSEQISKKPEVNNTTPHRHNSATQPFVNQDAAAIPPDPRAHIYALAPPPYNTRRTQALNTYAPPPLSRDSSRARSSATYMQGSYSPSGPNPPQSFGSKPAAQYGNAPGPRLQHELPAEMSALVVQDTRAADVDLPAEFQQLFTLSETWARNYANVPDTARDNALPKSLVEALKRLSDPNLAFGLLSSGSSRYFLIATVINNWITRDVIRVGLIKGISPSHDVKIGESKRQIRPNMPDHLRRACMLAVADTVKEIQGLSAFDSWLASSIDTKAAKLWQTLAVLLAPGADTAWEDFRYLVAEAHRVSLALSSLPLTYSFEYTSPGPHSYFDPSSMLNRDPIFKGDPMSLKRQQLKVRLGITPVVVTTDMMGSAIMPKTVHFANVLLMQ